MGKSVFDDISENNIVSGKRTDDPKKTSKNNAGTSKSTDQSDKTLVAIEKLGENMFEGFSALTKSLGIIGKQMVQAVNQSANDEYSMDYSDEENDSNDMDKDEGDESNSDVDGENIFQTLSGGDLDGE